MWLYYCSQQPAIFGVHYSNFPQTEKHVILFTGLLAHLFLPTSLHKSAECWEVLCNLKLEKLRLFFKGPVKLFSTKISWNYWHSLLITPQTWRFSWEKHSSFFPLFKYFSTKFIIKYFTLSYNVYISIPYCVSKIYGSLCCCVLLLETAVNVLSTVLIYACRADKMTDV